MYDTILMFIKLDNFGLQHLNRSRHLFHSFCCTTCHIFEPLHVYESSFNMDKYSNYWYNNLLSHPNTEHVNIYSFSITKLAQCYFVLSYKYTLNIRQTLDIDKYNYCEYYRYHIAGHLHGVQLLQMPSIYHEPVIFIDVLFTTWHFFASV